MDHISSGIEGLDGVLGGGLLAGDNVVWFGGDDVLHELIRSAFFTAAPTGSNRFYVTTREAPAAVIGQLGRVEILDARPGQELADPLLLERTVVERGADHGWVLIDALDDFVRRLGPERTVALFSRICPPLFDAGAICYWRAGDGARAIREGVRNLTQCVLEISDDRLRIDKAEGRFGAQGRVYRLRVSGDEVTIEQERAIGRLAEGLRQLRGARRLSQSDLARIAGVSPSAISQAEAGHRGLGLDTVIAIADGVGVGLDELLSTSSTPGYVLARRDRAAPRRGVTPLLDDPALGLRAYLVHLGPGEHGEPPAGHKGPELIVVASGLVQIDFGTETPVMRAGDAALATTVAVHSWRNLAAGSSRLFWIPRDRLQPDA